MGGLNFAVLFITDGRTDYHERSLKSAKGMLPEPVEMIKIDDPEHKMGFAGAIDYGWKRLRKQSVDWVFHLEGDFTFERPVPIARMIGVLERRPELAQLVLKRQPWNEREKLAGGIIEADPQDFEQVTDRGDVWTEHRKFWSTNPSLYSVGWCHQDWPQVERSEGVFTHRLLEDPQVKFGLWGAKKDPPAVIHIGDERTGNGY